MLEMLLEQLRSHFLRYQDLPKQVLYQDDEDRDLNIFIGVKGRANYLKTTLQYFMLALSKEPKFRTKIIIVEHDKKPSLAPIAAQFDAEYIFIDNAYTNTGTEFSRSLCFNIGHAWTKESTWSLQHDCDLLVPEDFLVKLGDYMVDGVDWVQPYADKRVRMLTPQMTQYIMQKVEQLSYVSLQTINDYILYGQGATGGSLLIRNKVFEDVGGYEESFYGYAPEDSFLWTKLEAMHGTIGNGYMPHRGFGTYVNDINLYHLHHPNHWNESARLYGMLDLYNCFCNLDYALKLKYIGMKAKQFKEAML